jgi:hypothetical protein
MANVLAPFFHRAKKKDRFYFCKIWTSISYLFGTRFRQFGQLHGVLFTLSLTLPTSVFLLSVPVPISMLGDEESCRCSRFIIRCVVLGMPKLEHVREDKSFLNNFVPDQSSMLFVHC